MAAPEAAASFRVALTFDAEHPDRPTDSGAETRLFAALEAEGVPATFFVQGRWAEAYPDRARRIADGGHLVGSHGFYHARMTLLSDTGLFADIHAAEAAIVAATGTDPKPWFRCPFGDGMDDPRVLGAIESAGYRHVGWDVNIEDWEADRDAPTVGTLLVDGILARRGGGDPDSIVLLHSWPAGTGAGVSLAIARLREAGASFVRVDELLPT